MLRPRNNVYSQVLKQAPIFLSKIFRSHASNSIPKRVHLHNFHAEKNARFVDFAGFLMPLQYGDFSLVASHKHTREHVSIFDVSHMLQTKISGKDSIKFIESLVVSDIEGLGINQGTLTVFTNDNGGIIDDLIVTKTDKDYLYVVSNAGCIDKDLAHMNKRKEEFIKNGNDINLEILKEKVLLAIQGPGAATILQKFVDFDLSDLSFMNSRSTSICKVDDCQLTRCGYTGEDGFEISVPAAHSRLILENLLSSKLDDVKLAGLGARDTLRLEAGLCLYGNDITDETTPVEAGLAWTIDLGKCKCGQFVKIFIHKRAVSPHIPREAYIISAHLQHPLCERKRRREIGGFPGDSIILKQLKDKPKKKRVGFLSEGPCPRASTKIMNLDGDVIGKVTSGVPSPCLKKNISMGYIDADASKLGNKVKFLIHKKEVAGSIVKMPFVQTKYYVKK